MFTGSKAPRNLVMICLDTVRKDVFSLADRDGPEDSLKPWVQRALRVEKAQSAAPWTVPSVASIFTGLYPNQHGAGRFSELPANLNQEVPSGIAPSVPTLTEQLAEEGFETIGFTAHPWFTLDYGLDRGFSALHLRQSAEELVRLGVEWIDGRDAKGSESAAEGSSPFFLYLHFMEAHERHRRPEAELNKVLASRSESWLNAMVSMAPGGICDSKEQLSCRQWLAYGTAISDLRSQVANLLSALESRGLLEESVVVLYSDHGEEFMDHREEGRKTGGDPRSLYGTGHGQSLYQELLHVPLLVWYPQWPGGVLEKPVSLIDVMPSLQEWFGLASTSGDSRPPGVAFATESTPGLGEGRPIFSSGIAYGVERASVVEGKWKRIVQAKGGESLLFDLQKDSGERQPLKESTNSHLGDLLERYIAFGEGVSRAKPVDIPPEKLKELQALGYLEGQ